MSANTIEKFRTAMQTVYGDALKPQGEAAEHWIAPPKSGGHRGRYLWTDAFGVLNFLTLFKETGETKYLTLAKRLVQSVHDVLGWTRDGKSRLPEATDQDPLGGGLRIGKLEESGADGDGQYHHYLTLWMFALNRLSIASGDQMYNDQAIALVRAIHARFFIGRTTSNPRMVWKISTDRKRVLVASQGHLDATTGFVVCRLIQAASQEPRVLEEEIADYRKIMELRDSLEASNDTLDLGMALWVAHWYIGAEVWAETLAQNCIKSAKAIFDERRYTERTLPNRLAFREFGALLGVKCYGMNDQCLQARMKSIMTLWEKRMEEMTPEDLRPITMVMYSAALLPTAFRKNGLSPEPEYLKQP